MRLKSTRKTLILTFLTIFGVLFCILAAFFLFMPAFLQNRIFPELAKNAGIERFSCGVRRIGLFGADLEDIRLGIPSKPGIVVDTLKINYSPVDLFHKTVREIRLNGVAIYAEYMNGAFSIPGIIPIKENRNGENGQQQTAGGKRDFLIQKILLSNAVIELVAADRTYRIPFSIEATPSVPGMDRLSCRAKIYPLGQIVELVAGLDLVDDTCDIRLASTSFRLDSITAASDAVEGLAFSGIADITVLARIGLSPFVLDSISVDALIHDPHFSYGKIRVTRKMGDEIQPVPIKLSVARKHNNPWKISLSDLRLSSPFPVVLANFSAGVDIHEDTISGKGEILASLAPVLGDESPVAVVSPLNLAGNMAFNFPDDGTWSFELKSNPNLEKESPADGASVKIGDIVIAPGRHRFQFAAKGNSGDIAGDFSLSVEGLSAISGPLSGKFETITAGGDFVSAPGGKTLLNLACESTDARIGIEDGEINLPKTTLMGRIENPGGPDMQLSGKVAVSGARAAFSTSQMRLTGMSADLPFSWPWRTDQKSGNLNIRKIRFDGMDLGLVSGKLRQNRSAIEIQGTHHSHVIDNFAVTFSGKSEFQDSGNGIVFSMDYKSQPYNPTLPLDLGRLTATAKGFTLDGGIALAGTASFNDRGFALSLNAGIQNGMIENSETDLSVKNIQAQLFFPNLLAFKSAPKQVIEFASLNLGGISIKEGLIEYQMESGDSFLIEKAGFNWCDGHVDTHALRITGNTRDYNLVLYCDRLNLAMLLEQFGAADADGKGTVNGRIPLRYTNGKLVFKDGFLYSTPGRGGRIRVRNTEKLLAGIPAGSPEYTQMDLAREVLKSYDYQWATLGLSTEGNDLMMRLSFDGRPTNPLPFVYEKDIGGFAKIEAGKEGSVFQGVNMDINFRLPLDTMLQYRKVINMMQ